MAIPCWIFVICVVLKIKTFKLLEKLSIISFKGRGKHVAINGSRSVAIRKFLSILLIYPIDWNGHVCWIFTTYCICCEGRTQYVTNSATGCVKLVTPLDDTVEFLTHLEDLFRNFGIHLRGQTGMDSWRRKPVYRVLRFLKRCVSDVQLPIGSDRITNVPEGTVDHKILLAYVKQH